jgi:hypothetical protein
MNKTVKSTAVVAAALLALAGSASAQVEVLQPEQVAAYRQQLPGVAGQVSQANFKTYLQSLRPDTASEKAVANAVRVANDLKTGPLAANAFFGHYAVPALSPAMRLPDAYPADGKFGGEVRMTLAGDQYENASFVVYPFANIGAVDLKVSALRSAGGSTLPAESVDLKVVKVWYQNGNGWFSYFADPGLQLVPELLLHDENLIRVDTAKKANYARIKTNNGTKELWISAPQKLDIGFDPYQDGFADAKTLQPVAFKAGEFKQFVLTAHATPSTRPGIYRGHISVTANGQQAQLIPVAVRVLPFQLPQPKTNYDINKDFVVNLFSVWPTLELDSKAFLPTLKNMRRHNLLQVGPEVSLDTTPQEAAKQVQLMKEAGFLTNLIFNNQALPAWRPYTLDKLVEVKRLSRDYRDFFLKYFGHSNAIMRKGDEVGADMMVSLRPYWRIVHQNGMKTFIAGKSDTYFNTSGYTLDVRPVAGFPEEAGKVEKWNEIGNGYTGFYAGQHNGSENPAFVRRQHGMLGYLSNFDAILNYQFAYGPWNDRAWDLYKPMVLAYPISDGLVDTLAWEGFRAGVDDIRYATKLRQLADEAIASGDLDRVEAGRKVRQWFAMLDGRSADLSAVRLEMIEKIAQMTAKNGAAQK